jgi:hypothetical protein
LPGSDQVKLGAEGTVDALAATIPATKTSSHRSEVRRLKTFKGRGRKFIAFEIDTEAKCSVIFFGILWQCFHEYFVEEIAIQRAMTRALEKLDLQRNKSTKTSARRYYLHRH